MKTIVCICFATIALTCCQAFAGNYILTIDDKKYEIDLDQPVRVELSGGKNVRLSLEKKEIVSFNTANFSFDHPSEVTPSRTDLGDGLYQTMMATPLGTLVLVQEYTTMDPGGLVDMMINELTKEEKQYGYTITNSPSEIRLGSKKILTGKKSVATFREEKMTRHVLCYSIRDAGIMVITQVDEGAPKKDKSMVDTFWNTLEVSIK